MRKKYYRLILISLELNWAVLGAYFKISYWIWSWYIKIDRFFFWTINKMESEVEKLYKLTFGSGEPFWELILKFQFKYWLLHIKIDHFHGLSIKWVQKWKNRTGSLLAQVTRLGVKYKKCIDKTCFFFCPKIYLNTALQHF